jgi:hypothetical protein
MWILVGRFPSAQFVFLTRFPQTRMRARTHRGLATACSRRLELRSTADKCSLVFSTTANTQLSPPESLGIDKTNGKTFSKQILIGKTLYSYLPAVKRLDGGRPWVRSVRPPPTSSSPGLAGLTASLSGEEPTTSTAFFKRLIEDVNGAQSIQELGPTTVDGQQVSEYSATTSMTKLLAIRLSQKRIETAEQDKAFKTLAAQSVTIELFVTTSGLPLRTIDVIGPRNEGIGIEQDILATGIPVVVHAPPARLTITQARLIELEKHHAKKSHSGKAASARTRLRALELRIVGMPRGNRRKQNGYEIQRASADTRQRSSLHAVSRLPGGALPNASLFLYHRMDTEATSSRLVFPRHLDGGGWMRLRL